MHTLLACTYLYNADVVHYVLANEGLKFDLVQWIGCSILCVSTCNRPSLAKATN